MTTYATHHWSAQTSNGKVMVNHQVVWVPTASDNGLEIPIADEGFQIYLPESRVDDLSTTDDAGDSCEWYFPEYCSGQWDDGDFVASSQCCACGGGSVPSEAPASRWFQSSGGA